MIEKPVFERLELRRLRAAQNPGNEAHRGFQHHQGRELPAGEYIVSDGDLVPVHSGPNPLVESFIATTQKQQPIPGGQLSGLSLCEGLASGAQKDLVERSGPFGFFNSFKDRVRLEHHARATSEGPIIDFPMRVTGVVAKIDQLDPELPLTLRDAQNALVQIGSDSLWKERQNRTEHGVSPRRKASSVEIRKGSVKVGCSPG